MFRVLLREYHQSFLVVALAMGVILGAIVGMMLRIRFFVSPGWMVLVLVVFCLAYFRPKLWLTMIVFLAGIVLMFFDDHRPHPVQQRHQVTVRPV